MSKIVTTDLGRFRGVTDGKTKWWLWECPDCKGWGGLTPEQWDGKVSVLCQNPVRDHHGMDPINGMKPCGYHQTHEFGKELVARMQVRMLFGEDPFDKEPETADTPA